MSQDDIEAEVITAEASSTSTGSSNNNKDTSSTSISSSSSSSNTGADCSASSSSSSSSNISDNGGGFSVDPKGPLSEKQRAVAAAALRAERIKRLTEVRLARNSSRMENRTALLEEDKREKHGPALEAKEKRDQWLKAEEEAAKEAVRMGRDPEREKLLQTSMEDADRLGRKKKVIDNFEWNIYNDESQARAHERRVKSFAGSMGSDRRAAAEAQRNEYEEQRDSLRPEQFYKAANSLHYAEMPPVAEANIDRMVSDLQKQVLKREKFSRKRAAVEGEDVTSINPRNKAFNQKISRFYDKYTVEIKQNLERGTAI